MYIQYIKYLVTFSFKKVFIFSKVYKKIIAIIKICVQN